MFYLLRTKKDTEILKMPLSYAAILIATPHPIRRFSQK